MSRGDATPGRGGAAGDGTGDEAVPLGALPDDDPTAVLLRRALAAEASTVRPRPDGLQAIRARTGSIPVVTPARGAPAAPAGPGPASRPGRRRRVALLAVAAAGLVAAGLSGGALVAGLVQPSPAPLARQAPEPATTTDAEARTEGTTEGATEGTTQDQAPTAYARAVVEAPVPSTLATVPVSLSATATTRSVPVYWVGPVGEGFRLFREFRAPAPGGGDRVEQAVRTMLADRPSDPDYGSLWRPAEVRVLAAGDDGITVDVGAQALAGSTAGEAVDAVRFDGAFTALAAASLQQLVWTATAAYGRPVPVTLLVDGAARTSAWDVAPLTPGMTRQAGLRAPVWVIDPQQGHEPSGTVVRATGVGDGPGRDLEWLLEGPDGARRSGTLTTADDGTWSAALPTPVSGRYRLAVLDAGTPADGRPVLPATDTKDFVVAP